jgi:hypothetical protein
MNKYKGILDYNAQSKTMTPRTDAVCDEFAPSCKNPPFHYIANHARKLEIELDAARAQNLELESALEIAVAAMPNVES